MSELVIRVKKIGKRYRIGAKKEKLRNIRDAILDAVKSPFNNFKNLKKLTNFSDENSKETNDIFWALKDVSFEVNEGEVVGIIGRNGAGKSTLLKILTRITEPTEGYIEMKGRVSSLLEVGTGFHPELTGRENVYLNGAILGMRKWEIDKKFDEIVTFSEIEKFIDTPVKRYSSGMQVRLAFAVAAHLEPEILLVDEVLAVGDMEFQKKCMGKMDEVAKKGRTVLFVSHNMAAVQQLCSRSILLKNGFVKFDGATVQIVRNYLNGHDDNSNVEFKNQNIKKTTDWQIISAYLRCDGQKTNQYLNGQHVEIRVLCKGEKKDNISLEALIRDKDHVPILFLPCGLKNGENFAVIAGSLVISIDLYLPFLAKGCYYIDLIIANSGIRTIDLHESCLNFEIESTMIEKTGWSFFQNRGQGCILFAGRSYISNEY